MRPWLDPKFAEVWEAIRSFIVSTIIGAYLVVRWLKTRRGHKLDSHIKLLLAIEQEQLAIEQEQLPLAARPDAADGQKLQSLLERLSLLKQEAFRNCSVREINEDRALSCFIQMCDGLSDTINAKMSRLRLNSQLGEIAPMKSEAQALPLSEFPPVK